MQEKRILVITFSSSGVLSLSKIVAVPTVLSGATQKKRVIIGDQTVFVVEKYVF